MLFFNIWEWLLVNMCGCKAPLMIYIAFNDGYHTYWCTPHAMTHITFSWCITHILFFNIWKWLLVDIAVWVRIKFDDVYHIQSWTSHSLIFFDIWNICQSTYLISTDEKDLSRKVKLYCSCVAAVLRLCCSLLQCGYFSRKVMMSYRVLQCDSVWNSVLQCGDLSRKVNILSNSSNCVTMQPPKKTNHKDLSTEKWTQK